MREIRDACHIAIPAGDLDAAVAFYVDGLGVKLARRYADRVTFDFFGDQLVCHHSGDIPSAPVPYPRHFGVSFARREDFDRLLRLVELRKLPVLGGPSVRFAGTADLQEIKETAMQLSEVQAVFTTAGDPDALVWLQVPDVERLGQVIEQLRRRGRVTGTKTLIVLDTWSRHRALESNGLPVHT